MRTQEAITDFYGDCNPAVLQDIHTVHGEQVVQWQATITTALVKTKRWNVTWLGHDGRVRSSTHDMSMGKAATEVAAMLDRAGGAV